MSEVHTSLMSACDDLFFYMIHLYASLLMCSCACLSILGNVDIIWRLVALLWRCRHVCISLGKSAHAAFLFLCGLFFLVLCVWPIFQCAHTIQSSVAVPGLSLCVHWAISTTSPPVSCCLPLFVDVVPFVFNLHFISSSLTIFCSHVCSLSHAINLILLLCIDLIALPSVFSRHRYVRIGSQIFVFVILYSTPLLDEECDCVVMRRAIVDRLPLLSLSRLCIFCNAMWEMDDLGTLRTWSLPALKGSSFSFYLCFSC